MRWFPGSSIPTIPYPQYPTVSYSIPWPIANLSVLVNRSFPEIHQVDSWIHAEKTPEHTKSLTQQANRTWNFFKNLFSFDMAFTMFYPKRMWRNSMVLLQIFWRKTTSARPPSFRGFQQHQLPSHDLRLDLSGREELPRDIVWLVVNLPLWKIWVRQLGYVGIIVPNLWKNKIHVQTTNPMTESIDVNMMRDV